MELLPYADSSTTLKEREEGRKGKNHRVPYPLRRNFDFGASQKPSAPTKKAQFRLHADYVSEAYLGSEMLIY